MLHRLSTQRCQALSLTELLVTMAVMALISALLLPVLHHVRERGKTAQCLMQLRQWGSIIQAYAAEQRAYPAAVTAGSEATPWYTTVTSYVKNRRDIYCPQKKNGRSEYFSYNIYLGWARANVDTTTKPYLKVMPVMVRQPSATGMLTDGSADKQSDGTGTYIYRKVRKIYNHDKHHGGANWIFCDGHGEWITKERALELGGSPGDGFPFVRPF